MQNGDRGEAKHAMAGMGDNLEDLSDRYLRCAEAGDVGSVTDEVLFATHSPVSAVVDEVPVSEER